MHIWGEFCLHECLDDEHNPSNIEDTRERCFCQVKCHNVQALVLREDHERLDFWKNYAFDCASPALGYFGDESIRMCRVARNFVPFSLRGRGVRLASVPQLVSNIKDVVWCDDWKREQ